MAWKEGYLDVVLIPFAVLFPAVYHLWLWLAVRRRPLRSTVGINTAARRFWVLSMMKVHSSLRPVHPMLRTTFIRFLIITSHRLSSSMRMPLTDDDLHVHKRSQDNEKKAVLTVQSIRNVLMGSTLVGTTSVLLCTGVAAVLSSTYAVKKPLSDAVFGAHGETMTALKYVVLLSTFLLAFLCHSLAICTLNQATFLVNALSPPSPDAPLRLPAVDRDYVVGVLERGFLFNLVGNRLFFAGAPLLLWIFGPVLPCLCSAGMVPMLHSIDMVEHAEKKSCNGEADARVNVNTDHNMQV
jgi:uncharacterized membrane protein